MESAFISSYEKFIEVDGKTYGGSDEIFRINPELSDFSREFASGFISVVDILIYELHKAADALGTYKKLSFTIEEYSNLLRNYIDSNAYRQFGFMSVNAMEGYLKRFSDYRRLKFKIETKRDFVSGNYFKSLIYESIKNDHPLILQVNPELEFKRFSVITGIEDEKITLSSNGGKFTKNINEIYKIGDLKTGILNLEVII